jgi:hypothetical protein
MTKGHTADTQLVDEWGKLCANMPVKIKPVMWGNQVFRASYRKGKTDKEGRLNIDGILPDLQYYITDSRKRPGPRDMHYSNTLTLIPSKVQKRDIVSFEGIDIDFDMDQAKDKIVLVCFFDMNQRPSRHYLMQLIEKARQLKNKNTTIVAIQASKIEESALKDWAKKNDVPFPVGRIVSDKEKTRLIWGVKSLPWLILTDKKHMVRAEGFDLNELEEKLREIEHAEE